MELTRTLVLGASLLTLAACMDDKQAGSARQADHASPTLAEKSSSDATKPGAMVQLAPTQGQVVAGSLALDPSPQGVRITGAIQGLRPDGEYGFHVHEKGDCSAPDASSAGEHFNPTQQPHGDPTTVSHHAGDMVNIRSNSEGVAQVDTTAAGLAVGAAQDVSEGGGANAAIDVVGKAIVVHERADDYKTQPAGNSGVRIACGVIGVQTDAEQSSSSGSRPSGETAQ